MNEFPPVWFAALDVRIQQNPDQHERTRLQRLALFAIRAIVGNYGGSIEVDLATDTLKITVPKDQEDACAMAVQQAMEKMGC